jgi:hypothetical protein
MDDLNINSKEYWDMRFKTDWETNGGQEQTIYFTKLALSLLPEIFMKIMKEKRLSLLDWGCAEGEGTVLLAENFNSSKVVGLDFATSAIEKARFNHPNFSFLDGKIEDYDEAYDVIFTSNCLEHYKNPIEWVKYLLGWSKHFLVVLIPFQEYDRINEHFYTFDYESFNLRINNFSLVFHKEIETDPKYWRGKQLMLVYGNNDSELLSLLNLEVYRPNEFEDLQRVHVLSELNNEIEKRNEILAFIQTENKAKEEWIGKLQEEVQKRDEILTFIQNENKVKEEWIEKLQEEVRKRDELTILIQNELQEEVTNRDNSVVFLQKEIKEKDTWIKRLQDEIKAQES